MRNAVTGRMREQLDQETFALGQSRVHMAEKLALDEARCSLLDMNLVVLDSLVRTWSATVPLDEIKRFLLAHNCPREFAEAVVAAEPHALDLHERQVVVDAEALVANSAGHTAPARGY